jgi:hypothetical protein
MVVLELGGVQGGKLLWLFFLFTYMYSTETLRGGSDMSGLRDLTAHVGNDFSHWENPEKLTTLSLAE